MPAPICQQCGDEIAPPNFPSRPRKFCGNPCKLTYQRRNPARPRIPRAVASCGTCGEPVEYLPSQRGSRLDGRTAVIYCSRKCFGIGHSATMTGRRPSGGVYTSNATFRVLVRREFLDQCAICGWAEASCDVAHIIARKNGGNPSDLENVTMLCPNHHRMYDTGKIPETVIRETRASVLR